MRVSRSRERKWPCIAFQLCTLDQDARVSRFVFGVT